MSCAAVGVLTVLLLPSTIYTYTRALVGWDVGVGLYLILAWALIMTAPEEQMQRRAREQDDGAAVILLLTMTAAVASVGAIVLELLNVKSAAASATGWHVALAGVTIVLSWFFVHTSFALHYAHEYYSHGPHAKEHCLKFPDESLRPGYSDFLYFSFILGATSQTADVAITSAGMRRLVLIHSIVSFFFNTTLLAMAVNIAASLV
jgi:uncharacterized membrane protein